MRLVLQRVSQASVSVDGQNIASIQHGLLLLVGVEKDDTKEEIKKLAQKISRLRIFEDDHHKMNHSIKDVAGEILSVSQFTLLANTKRGNRPSFDKAEKPSKANVMYEYFNQCLQDEGLCVQTGQFGADMDVALHNDGPVTLIFDTRESSSCN